MIKALIVQRNIVPRDVNSASGRKLKRRLPLGYPHPICISSEMQKHGIFFRWGGGIPFIPFLEADVAFLGLPFWDMDFYKARSYSEFSSRLTGEGEVWQCPGKVPEAQAEDRNIWSAESAGRPWLDQLPAPPHQPEHGHREQGLQAEPSTL